MDRYTEPDLDSIALITIDTQRDTLDGAPLEIPGTSAILPKMALLLGAFRAAGKPIVHVVRLYRPDGANVDLCRRAAVEDGAQMLVAGSEGSELAAQLYPRPGTTLEPDLLLAGGVQELGPSESVIYKPRWGAFYRTPLHEHLKDLGVTTLAFTGCNYPNCPRASIFEASERDFRIVLVQDAVSGLDDRGANEMRNIGVCLMSFKELAGALGKGA